MKPENLTIENRVNIYHRWNSVFGSLSISVAKNAKYIAVVLDVLIFLFTFLSAAIYTNNRYIVTEYISAALFLFFIWALLAFTRSLYHRLLTDDAQIIMNSYFKMWGMYVLICIALYTMLLHTIFSLKIYSIILVVLSVSLFINKIILLSFRKKFKTRFVTVRKVAVIGSSFIQGRPSNYRNFYDGQIRYQILSRHHEKDVRLNNDENVKSDIYYMYKNGITEIFCCMFAFNKEEVKQLLASAEKYMIRVRFLPTFSNFQHTPVSVNYIGKVPAFSTRKEPLLSEYNSMVKRCFDIAFSLFAIIFIFSWLYPIIAILIKLESKGPVLFKQERSGMDNYPFMCYKFRSMVVNTKSDEQQATKNDSRITKVGAFLRRTSLDELPQFFNVLKGQMSVVGPRPHMLKHTSEYRKLIDSFMVRHYVKPGITGWAQVNGYRGETKDISMMDKRVQFDIDYLQNWTFMQDMKIIFLTVWNVFKGEENAY